MSRFTKISAAGNALTATAKNWVAVHDRQTDLTWTRGLLDCGAVSHKGAIAAAAAVRLFGHKDWHLATLPERFSIIDYTKSGPALDTTYFNEGNAYWEWTSTVDATSPSDCAWLVYLHYGYVGRYYQTARSSVRAVRAGQPLGFGLRAKKAAARKVAS